MERRIGFTLSQIKEIVDVARNLPPRKLYTQDKLNKLAKECEASKVEENK